MAVSLLLLLSLLLQLSFFPRVVVAQYFTGVQGSAVAYGGTAGLSATSEPTCLVDSAAVWARSASVAMWAISGGSNYETDFTTVYTSTTAFTTSTALNPTYTVANAILRNRRAGGAVIFQNGTGYPAGTVFMWGGNTDEDVGDAAIYTTSDNFVTINRPRTNAAPSPCPYADTTQCTISPQYARFAYTILPYTNYIVHGGRRRPTARRAPATCTSPPTRASGLDSRSTARHVTGIPCRR